MNVHMEDILSVSFMETSPTDVVKVGINGWGRIGQCPPTSTHIQYSKNLIFGIRTNHIQELPFSRKHPRRSDQPHLRLHRRHNPPDPLRLNPRAPQPKHRHQISRHLRHRCQHPLGARKPRSSHLGTRPQGPQLGLSRRGIHR